jgi:hypothetical protein
VPIAADTPWCAALCARSKRRTAREAQLLVQGAQRDLDSAACAAAEIVDRIER